jgi:hypothetical protein
MFVRQGAEQIRTWTGLEPPVELMSRVVKTTLMKDRDRVQGTGKSAREKPG